MSFEKFTLFGGTFKPKVSIRATGHIGFSQGAVSRFKLDKMRSCELYFDRETNRIGFRFFTEEPGGTRAKVNQRGADCFISSRSFLNYYDVDYKVSRSFEIVYDEKANLFILDLNKGTTRGVRGSRGAGEKHKDLFN